MVVEGLGSGGKVKTDELGTAGGGWSSSEEAPSFSLSQASSVAWKMGAKSFPFDLRDIL